MKRSLLLNILLLGVAGTGKSSFINSILTSLLPHNCELANIDDSTNVDSAQHIGRLRCFPISQNLEELGKCHINLWETSGIDESNFNFELLSEILKGNIPDGFEMIETIQGKNIPCSPSHNDVNRRIHAVLLFVPVNICEDIPMLKRLSNILVGMTCGSVLILLLQERILLIILDITKPKFLNF